ncbi:MULTISPECIES: hypothetical protein [unclassified Microbacterium]|uniref:hypothetical protein n=1 Tax=unclassified Microbacterium TaxID=2609290 RepID=UPI003C2ACC02
MARLLVTGAVAVLPTADGREQYFYKGAIVDSDAFTEKGVEHARSMGLVDDAPELPEEDEDQALTAADVEAAAQLVEAAAQKVADAKAELELERQALDAEKAELAKEREEFDAAKAKAPAAKQTAAKQS